MEFSFDKHLSGEVSQAHSVALDPAWRDEIEAATIADLAGRGLTEDEVARRVEGQLKAATELTASILAADAFVNTEQLALVMSPRRPGITADDIRLLREEGRLLYVQVGERAVYPLFQFRRDGTPHDVVYEVNRLFSDGRSSWHRAVWWFLSTPRLGDKSPREWIGEGGNTDAVLGVLQEVAS